MIRIGLVMVLLVTMVTARHPGDTTDQHNRGAPQGRIYPVSETTTWQLVEDMEFYQNGLRYLHGTPELRFNWTVNDGHHW